jgi:DNA-directed RNA polymerase subunit omega
VLALREIATSKVRFDRNVRDAIEGKFDHEKLPPNGAAAVKGR